jgi:hypothetical protein
MAPSYDVLALYSAAVAPVATGAVHDLGDVRRSFELVIFGTFATLSIQLNGSLDGVNWFTMGAAVTALTAAAPALIASEARYVRADLPTLTGGNVTAELAYGVS